MQKVRAYYKKNLYLLTIQYESIQKRSTEEFQWIYTSSNTTIALTGRVYNQRYTQAVWAGYKCTLDNSHWSADP